MNIMSNERNSKINTESDINIENKNIPLFDNNGGINYGQLRRVTENIKRGKARITSLSTSEELGRSLASECAIDATVIFRGPAKFISETARTGQEVKGEVAEGVRRVSKEERGITLEEEMMREHNLTLEDITKHNNVYFEATPVGKEGSVFIEFCLPQNEH